jgi:hypothetical protein
VDKALGQQQITEFLARVGQRTRTQSVLLLLGGSGLNMLGNQRPTLDLDFDGEEKADDELRLLLEQVATEMQLEIEAVPLHRFFPLPSGVENRHIFIGTFGNLRVYVFDPYSIALTKLDRGFDADIDDIAFLLRQDLVNAATLESMIDQAAGLATAFDFNPNHMRTRLQLAIQLLNQE